MGQTGELQLTSHSSLHFPYSLFTAHAKHPGALPWPRGTAAPLYQSSGITQSQSGLGWIKDHGQRRAVWLVPPHLVSPSKPGCSHQVWSVPRSQNSPTKPCSVQLRHTSPTQPPLLFRQGWFKNQMRSQETVES